eukprot:5453268-Pleurochrysis_carterae.AAC.2
MCIRGERNLAAVCANRALRAASDSACGFASESTEASAARVWCLQCVGFARSLSLRGLRFGQSLCQWAPLHQRQGAHFSLHFSSGSGRGRLGSLGLSRFASPRTANACAAPGLDSSSRRTFRASASLSTPRAAPMVRGRLPTPAMSDSLTSSRVEMLSLRRRTAFAIFSGKTESGSCADAGSERLSRCIA